MNTIAYIIYLFLTYLLTFHVGFRFFRNGRAFILHLMNGELGITDSVNRILLTGYFLLNLGYATIMIRNWKTLNTWTELIGTILGMTGRIFILLGCIHFLNMAVIYLLSIKTYSSPTKHKS